MDLKWAISLLDAIDDLEPHRERLEPIAAELMESGDPTAAPAVIRCMERCGNQNDDGLFQRLGHYLAEIDPDEVVEGEHLKATLLSSLRRKPMWKTIELFHTSWFEEGEQRQVLPLLLDAPELDDDTLLLYAQPADDLGYRIVRRNDGWSLATERVD